MWTGIKCKCGKEWRVPRDLGLPIIGEVPLQAVQGFGECQLTIRKSP